MTRYICEPDIYRRVAGGGDHWWVVDTNFKRPKSLMFLLSEQDTKSIVDKLNDVPPRISGTRKLASRIFGLVGLS